MIFSLPGFPDGLEEESSVCRVTFCCAGLELPPEPDLHQVGVVGVGPVAAAARELRQEGDTLAASQQFPQRSTLSLSCPPGRPGESPGRDADCRLPPYLPHPAAAAAAAVKLH